MEKIYMEENNNENNRFNQKSRLFLTTTLSFVVAIFAMVSIAFFGISTQGAGISFAADESRVNNGFTLHVGRYGDNQIENVTAYNANGGNQFYVPFYYSDSSLTQQEICVETELVPNYGGNYTLNSEYSITGDAGIAYILSHSYLNGVPFFTKSDFVLMNQGDDISGEISDEQIKYMEMWVTQTAVWLYLHQKQAPNSALGDTYNYAFAATRFEYSGRGPEMEGSFSARLSEAAAIGFSSKLTGLIDDAASYNPNNAYKLTVKFENKETLNKSNDGKYYLTSKVLVSGSPSDVFQSYSLEVSGIEGAIAVDASGNQIKDLSNILPSVKEFYIRIPADKIKEEVQKLTVTASGKFKKLAVGYYVAPPIAASGVDAQKPSQKLARLTPSITEVSAGDDISIVGTPDTGLNITKTIYFIGLIVLLCGVGIIYANAKQVEVKQ